jgi:hypothetical protein
VPGRRHESHPSTLERWSIGDHPGTVDTALIRSGKRTGAVSRRPPSQAHRRHTPDTRNACATLRCDANSPGLGARRLNYGRRPIVLCSALLATGELAINLLRLSLRAWALEASRVQARYVAAMPCVMYLLYFTAAARPGSVDACASARPPAIHVPCRECGHAQ